MRVVSSKSIEWQPFGEVPGVSIFPLDERADGTMTLFAKVDKGCSVPPHIHNGPEETYMIKGRLDIGSAQTAEAGDYVLMDKGEKHSVTAQEETIFFVCLNQGFEMA